MCPCSTRSRAVEKNSHLRCFSIEKKIVFLCALNFLAVWSSHWVLSSIMFHPSSRLHCLWLLCEKATAEKVLCGMTNLNESRRVIVMQCFDTRRDEKGLIALSLAFDGPSRKLKSGILEFYGHWYHQFTIVLCIAGASTNMILPFSVVFDHENDTTSFILRSQGNTSNDELFFFHRHLAKR